MSGLLDRFRAASGFADSNKWKFSKIGSLMMAGVLSVSSTAVFANQGTPHKPGPNIVPTQPSNAARAQQAEPPEIPGNITQYELQKRIVRLTGAISAESATSVIAQMKMLDEIDPKHGDINLIINSPGGSVTDGLAIYDAMRAMKSKVNAVCEGSCASMGAFLVTTATGKRTVMPNAALMYHQLSNSCDGRGTDIDICNEDTQKIKRKMNKILAEHSGLSEQQVRDITERDYWIDSADAVAYGLVDEIRSPVQRPRRPESRTIPQEVVDRIMHRHL